MSEGLSAGTGSEVPIRHAGARVIEVQMQLDEQYQQQPLAQRRVLINEVVSVTTPDELHGSYAENPDGAVMEDGMPCKPPRGKIANMRIIGL